MLTRLRRRPRPLWMNTSEKVEHTEVAQARDLIHLSSAPDLKTVPDTEEGIPETEPLMTVEDTGGEVAHTSRLDAGHTMVMGEVATEEGVAVITTRETIVVEDEVSLKCGCLRILKNRQSITSA